MLPFQYDGKLNIFRSRLASSTTRRCAMVQPRWRSPPISPRVLDAGCLAGLAGFVWLRAKHGKHARSPWLRPGGDVPWKRTTRLPTATEVKLALQACKHAAVSCETCQVTLSYIHCHACWPTWSTAWDTDRRVLNRYE